MGSHGVSSAWLQVRVESWCPNPADRRVGLTTVPSHAARRDGMLLRPHPVVWRMVNGVAILYLMLLVFMVMNDVTWLRTQFLPTLFDPRLGTLPETNTKIYASDCRLVTPEVGSLFVRSSSSSPSSPSSTSPTLTPTTPQPTHRTRSKAGPTSSTPYSISLRWRIAWAGGPRRFCSATTGV